MIRKDQFLVCSGKIIKQNNTAYVKVPINVMKYYMQATFGDRVNIYWDRAEKEMIIKKWSTKE